MPLTLIFLNDITDSFLWNMKTNIHYHQQLSITNNVQIFNKTGNLTWWSSGKENNWKQQWLCAYKGIRNKNYLAACTGWGEGQWTAQMFKGLPGHWLVSWSLTWHYMTDPLFKIRWRWLSWAPLHRGQAVINDNIPTAQWPAALNLRLEEIRAVILLLVLWYSLVWTIIIIKPGDLTAAVLLGTALQHLQWLAPWTSANENDT